MPPEKTLLEFHMTVEQARFIALVLGNMNSKQMETIGDDGGRIGGEVWIMFSGLFPYKLVLGSRSESESEAV